MDQISLQISSAIDVARSFEQSDFEAEKERGVSEKYHPNSRNP
jgi:hypothetical protein